MIPNNFLQEKRTELTVSQLHTTKRKIKEIILHCSANPEGQDVKAAAIKKYHVEHNGWRDIGYNFVIDLDGTIEIGRNLDIAGAHTTNHNSISIGICYIGGLANIPGVAYKNLPAKDTRTPAQKESMYKLVHDLLLLYPEATVHGHYEFEKKACPSFKIDTFQREYHLWSVANKVLDKINN